MFTVTVKAKETATTAAPATTQASADATTGAVATTEVPASANASDNALKKVSLSTTNPKVGEVITAVLEPVNADDVKGYTWYEDDVEVSGNATGSYTVTEKVVGKKIRVTVTNKNGTKFESNSSAPVQVDNSTSVTIKDLDGFQADKTAYVDDDLTLIFGESLGLPDSVSWYVNGSLKKMYKSSAVAIDELSMAYSGTATGSCYAKVVVGDKTYTSNTVTIVGTPVKATLSDVKISEDYATPNVSLLGTTDDFVVSVTLNKDYNGVFYLVGANEKEVKEGTCGDGMSTVVRDANVKTDSKYMTEAVALAANDGIDHDNQAQGVQAYPQAIKRVLETKEVQYMFKAPKALKRGDEYKVVFEQAGIEGTVIGQSHNPTANLSDKVMAAYVKAPTKIVVTNPQTGSDVPGWTATLYNGDDVCKYIDDKNDYGACTAKATLTANTSTSTTTGTAFNPQIGSVKKGVFDGAAAGSCVAPAGNSYVYAKFEGGAGVFGKDKLTLTSAATKTATSIVSSASLAVSTSNVKNVDFTLNNLVASADVYLLSGEYDTSAEKTAFKAVKAFKDSKTKVGVVSVGPGNGSATLKDAISKVTNTTAGQGDVYTIAIIPQDEKAYAPYFGVSGNEQNPAATNANSIITVTQVETTLKLGNTTVTACAKDPNTATKAGDFSTDNSVTDDAAAVEKYWAALTNNAVVEFLDQYGNKIATSKAIASTPMTAMQRNSGNAEVNVIMNKDGKLTFISTAATGNNVTPSCSEGDVYTFTLSAKFTLQATVKTTSSNKADTMDFIIIEK